MSSIKSERPSPFWLKSERYINREFSWLQFNQRVLDEAENPKNALLERARFLAIFNSNLDEFFMVRVSGLIEQAASGLRELTPDGLSPQEQIAMIASVALPMRQRASKIWLEELRPELNAAGIRLLEYEELTDVQRREMRNRFREEIFTLLTPLILHPNPTFPFISNRSVNLAVELHDNEAGQRLGRVKIPTVVPRWLRIGNSLDFVLLDDVIKSNLKYLFPGVHIAGTYAFRVIRDADIEIRLLEAGDLVDQIEETIRRRRFGDPVMLEIGPDMPAELRARLVRSLELDSEDVYCVEGLLGLECLHELVAIDKKELLFPSFHPYVNESLATSERLFQSIRSDDILVHHPFDGFKPVEVFVESASSDPNVIGIKQTLYRVGAESPIVEKLLEAAEEHKQVAVMVELKARFDESNNLAWSRQLERAGVHVTYGFMDMKTHCKLCLVVRREAKGIKTYAHIGTGNYNPVTARVYTDLGLFTCDADITKDISELFNYLTGFSKQHSFRKLLVAPLNLRDGILERINREIETHKNDQKGHIIFKLNALVDPEIIDALYDASNAGVRVDLIVRGACCLRPGIPGLSDNISVRSVVGRFLEHSRIYYFENGGRAEALIGSSDLMRRNLDRRIEVLAPVENSALIEHIRSQILEIYLNDNTNSWYCGPDGTYSRIRSNDEPFAAQEWLLKHPSSKVLASLELPAKKSPKSR